MSDYVFIEFEDLVNTHIFDTTKPKTSRCGSIKITQHNRTNQHGPYTEKAVRREAIDLHENTDLDICGSCVGTFFSNEDTGKYKYKISEKMITEIVRKVVEERNEFK